MAITGDKSQEQRNFAIEKFSKGEIPILIGTDVVGRGLDLPDVKYVINYDSPKNLEDYIHRIGRTGRCGKTGTSYSLINNDNISLIKPLIGFLNKQKIPIPEFFYEITGKGFNKSFNSNNGNGSRGYGSNNTGNGNGFRSQSGKFSNSNNNSNGNGNGFRTNSYNNSNNTMNTNTNPNPNNNMNSTTNTGNGNGNFGYPYNSSYPPYNQGFNPMSMQIPVSLPIKIPFTNSGFNQFSSNYHNPNTNNMSNTNNNNPSNANTNIVSNPISTKKDDDW